MIYPLKYAVFETAGGWMAVLASEKGLRRTTLPQPSERDALERLGSGIANARQAQTDFTEMIFRIQAYFTGTKAPLDFELDFASGTPLQVRIWRETARIPYGETRSYGWLAARAGRPGGARAVGQAMAHNPLPIVIPCHRVIASDGALCGFGGGLELKRYLLRLEGVRC